MHKNDYIREVQQKGGEGSARIRAITSPTLNNNGFVETISAEMRGLVIARIPDEFDVVAVSAHGIDSDDPEETASSLVHNLVKKTIEVAATPIGLADIVDANTPSEELETRIGNALLKTANEYNVAVMNGEYAILGDRITNPCLMSGVMIGAVPKGILKPSPDAAVFSHEGKPVYLNADGIGTKPEFYERLAQTTDPLEALFPGFYDFLVMIADDAARIGAVIKAVGGIIDYNSDNVPVYHLLEKAITELQKMDILSFMASQKTAGIQSYKPGIPAYNISGVAVSLLDEEKIKDPLVPKPGQRLMAMQSPYSNPRSNGISKCREAMTRLHGPEWHLHPEGLSFMKYLAQPSYFFYPVFQELVGKGLVSAFYHMSGGAFEEKLAEPLADAGLYAELTNLFKPDIKQQMIANVLGIGPHEAYQIWHMGNEAFVATDNVRAVSEVLARHNIRCNDVGLIQQADKLTGVTIITSPFGGKDLYFSGRRDKKC